MLKLHICTTCRQKVCCDSVGQLVKAAKLHAEKQQIQLEIEKTCCLSGCEQGLMAMVEMPEGMVRVKQVVEIKQISQLLDSAQRLIAGEQTPLDAQIVSRLNWAQWDKD